ncbi:hypothetical protein DSM112329_00721 [Paraconexibacter sp. AEG42_29]|uniref:type IV pilin protein n=1 Tax=Paraconexibacter sp. AEG42_29 TaxID=2997339 RepID=UPI00339DA3B9
MSATSHDDRAYTLPEVLVTLLVLAGLAAIAVPAFAGQARKADDVAVRQRLRDAATQLDLCFVERADYETCEQVDGFTPAEVLRTTILPQSYALTARSGAGTDYTIRRVVPAGETRTCAAADPPAGAGCRDGAW